MLFGKGGVHIHLIRCAFLVLSFVDIRENLHPGKEGSPERGAGLVAKLPR